jgi:hypothetical protein
MNLIYSITLYFLLNYYIKTRERWIQRIPITFQVIKYFVHNYEILIF